MKKIGLLMVIVMVLTVAASSTVATDLEREALMALYNDTGGPNWISSDGWGGDDPCDPEWYGVGCTDGHVTALFLWSNQLSGSIPAQLGSLTNLQHLYLRLNELSGSIPAELGNLTNLQSLNLFGNQLSNSIPTELGSLANLQSLSLGDNQLSGSIPTELGSLTNLQQLSLNDNQLSGPIPAWLSNLDLSYLALGNNPYLVCWQTEAALLWAQGLAEYYGPEEECTTDYLYLMALHNSTGGPNWTNSSGWGAGVPCVDSWHGVTCEDGHVTELVLASNQLRGQIPPELGNLGSLQWLDLSQNSLGGSVPPALGNLSSLTHLYLHENPDLVCWLSQAALDWALGLQGYDGPQDACPFVCLPIVVSAGD